jgi:hypothetical protein
MATISTPSGRHTDVDRSPTTGVGRNASTHGRGAGVLPLAVTPSAPINDPTLREGIAVPEYVKKFKR